MKRLLVKGGKLLDIQNGYRFDQKEMYIESGVIKDIDPLCQDKNNHLFVQKQTYLCK
jgi:hypothetical protein